MQMPSKGVSILLGVFFSIVLIGMVNKTEDTYDVVGTFDRDNKPLELTMTGCEFKPALELTTFKETVVITTPEYEAHGLIASHRLNCRADRSNSIYGVRSIDSITLVP